LEDFDVAIVGGGIVGLATAWQLVQRYPASNVIVIEKEPQLAAHQSRHNSGVLHSGIYYRPGSLRAINCRQGKYAMEQFCLQYGIPFEQCGKVIVAVNEAERERLQTIYQRGLANGVNCQLIDRHRLCELEPYTAGLAAVHVPETGIVNYLRVCQQLAELLQNSGRHLQLSSTVTAIHPEPHQVTVETTQGTIHARYLVTCGGLWEDRLIRLAGDVPIAQVVPFRGEFFKLKPEAEYLCRTLIYPVPDPAFPFLGVHFTRMISGGVECGPNAVLAFARDGYRKTALNLSDLLETFTYRGFQKMACKHWKTGLGEMWRSWSKAAFVKALQRLVPEIRSEHLIAAPSGVRAQALGADGKLLDDFVIQQSGRMIHVGNAPSPAATASLNIGNMIVDHLAEADLH